MKETIKRVICAIVGHNWRRAGWLGCLSINDDLIHCYICDRCLACVNVVEPAWHHRARHHKHIDSHDVPLKLPGRYKISSPIYDRQRQAINEAYPVDILASVHDVTIQALKEIGY